MDLYIYTMGAACCKSADGARTGGGKASEQGGTVGVMFRRIDKEGKGYIDLKNLEDLMKDDRTHFMGGTAAHIMEKFGNDGKMTLENFSAWWGSTYTTYNDDHMARLVEDAQQLEENDQLLDIIPELPEIPHNSNVAVSRS